jgi:glycosyltransferase involved in cell wall biosynthesis
MGHAHTAREPRVDIVVNNYNYARYLGEAIDSALEQSYERVQVIVVDDGSTDESRAIIAAYGERICPVLKANGGQASAVNAGFAASSADVVIFLDADDVLRPSAAGLAARAIAADPRVAKVQYRMEVIDADGRTTGELKPPDGVLMPSGDVRRLELTAPFDLTWLPTTANAFPAWALRRILPMPEPEFVIAADAYLRHLTALLGHVVSLYDVAAAYRVHGLNNYEPDEPVLELAYVRDGIRYAAATRPHIRRLADELALDGPDGDILSVADLVNRMISIRLEPEAHPLPEDGRLSLAAAGVRAAFRRFDVSPLMRVLCAAWFGLAAIAPRVTMRWLAEISLFRQRRPSSVNRLLHSLHRRTGELATARRH